MRARVVAQVFYKLKTQTNKVCYGLNLVTFYNNKMGFVLIVYQPLINWLLSVGYILEVGVCFSGRFR